MMKREDREARGLPARLTGIVVHGQGKGHTVGMPTANLAPDPGQALPGAGVYAVWAEWDDRKQVGVTNVGTRPSADTRQEITVETFIPGYAGDLYGKRMSLIFEAYLRPIAKFSSLAQVFEQVRKDAERAGEMLSGTRA